MISTTEEGSLGANCKPKLDSGNLCDLVSAPGKILAIRQTIYTDSLGYPILEQYKLPEGGNVIDDEGTWLIEVPMNLDYVTTNEFGERILSIEEIKDCCGVKDKLKQYIEFERRLLLIAQREINEKSDIKFEFERIKHLRKIVARKFIITQNKAYELRNNPEKELQEVKRTPPIAITLRDFGLSTRMVNTLLKENSETTLQNAVNAVDVQLKKGQVRNAKAMLLVAIKEKWHPDLYSTKKKS
jgi:hypothetical protein